MARQLDAAQQQHQYRSVNFATPDLQVAKLSVHALYSERPIDLHSQVVRKARIAKDAAVADIGCGTGAFLRYLGNSDHRGPLYGIDLGDGVFREAAGRQSGIGWVVADAVVVPLSDGAVDVACLQHMLGYVPDIAAACREARRVTRVGGTVVATTRSAADYPHALAYRERARDLFGWPAIEVNTTRFCLENMVEILEAALNGSIHLAVLPGRLRIPVSVYAKWFAQMALNWNPLPSDEEMAELRARLEADWLPADAERDGCIVEDKRIGVAWHRTQSPEVTP